MQLRIKIVVLMVLLAAAGLVVQTSCEVMNRSSDVAVLVGLLGLGVVFVGLPWLIVKLFDKGKTES